MSVAFFAAIRRLGGYLGVATALLAIGVSAGAQTPSADQLNALKNLPPDQQQQLLQGVLGTDGTNRKTDPKLNTPETVDRPGRLGEMDKETERGKTIDGRTLRRTDEDPELRAGDTVLIDLTPVELV